MANTKTGDAWPQAARNCGINGRLNMASHSRALNGIQEGRVSIAAQHNPTDVDRTFIITKYWGVAPQTSTTTKGKGGEVTTSTIWLKFPLWLMAKDTGGYPYHADVDTDFYYFQFSAQRATQKGWTPQLYVKYLAKNETQVSNFNTGTKGRATFLSGGGYAPQGGLSPGRDLTSSEQDRESGWVSPLKQGVFQGGNSAQEARLVFASRRSDIQRWQSLYSQQREDMDKIANDVRNARIGVPPSVYVTNEGDIADEIKTALLDAGYSQSQVDWYTSGGLTNPMRDGVNSAVWSGNQAGAVPPADPPQDEHILPPTPAVTRLVVRTPLGYTVPTTVMSGKPEIVQTYMGMSTAGNVRYHRMIAKTDRFIFPMIPNTVSYSGLGSRWVEIPRKGDFPIVEWSDWALMKVQFEFLVAHEMDGLFSDVSLQLNQLRRMAQRPNPVVVFGMDELFSLQVKRAARTGKALQFVIADFTIQSQRRTIEVGNKEITAAQCSMTLQEMPIEEMSLISMSIPPLADSAVPTTGDVDPNDINHLHLNREQLQLMATAGIIDVV